MRNEGRGGQAWLTFAICIYGVITIIIGLGYGMIIAFAMTGLGFQS